MGTWMLPCGCSGSSSMFGEHEILVINCCARHARNTELQAILHRASSLLKEIVYSDPGHWDYERGWVTAKEGL